MARKPTTARKPPKVEQPIVEPAGGEVLENPEPLEPTVTWVNPNIITNRRKGTTLHLGDGRRLAFGESASVSHELAVRLRESGQAE